MRTKTLHSFATCDTMRHTLDITPAMVEYLEEICTVLDKRIVVNRSMLKRTLNEFANDADTSGANIDTIHRDGGYQLIVGIPGSDHRYYVSRRFNQGTPQTNWRGYFAFDWEVEYNVGALAVKRHTEDSMTLGDALALSLYK